ncbi:serine/threonine-protein kinase [Streptosporangium sp. CA-135522]|uniref:serine/threonine-protein kinase n=1 Tax=Streptosporangium sp. CA-135522 TaxID=3240072 RepID=UPI003D8F2908
MTDPSLLAGRYRLLERLDRAGATWRSRDELLNRDVTIAEVRLPPPSPHRDWLLGQIRAAADLRHPGVVTLHDVISAPDRMWLVLEAVEGRSLLQTVRSDGPLSSERAAEVGLRVLDTLTAAHERGIHLAATPDTVLLASDGRVVLTGVAAPVPTRDLRDLRDLGATLFTAVEGRAPHTGSQTIPHMPDGTPVAALAPAADGPTGSGPLAPLVEGLLAADPAHRPDATSVRLSLERIAPKPAVSRRRPLIIAVAATAAVAVAAGAAFWLRPLFSDPAPTAAPRPLPASFGKAPDPCAVISPEQAAELFLDTGPSKEEAGRCSWDSADTGQPQSMRYRLWIQVIRSSSGEKAHADFTRFFKQESAPATSAAGLPVIATRPATPLPGIGAEAYTVEATNKLTYYTGVVFRAANLVVIVQYQRGGESDPRGDTRQGALRAGGWVLDALSRAG